MKNSLMMLGIVLAMLPFRNQAAPYAIATREIHLNGYNLFVDSFNSSDLLRSTAGQYDPLKAGGDQSVVGSETGVSNSINVGTVIVWGRLQTGLPFSLEFGPQSSIGSAAWHQASQTGFEPGFHETNFTYIFPDAYPPFASDLPASGAYNGIFYNYILNDGNYTLPSLTMSGGQKMLVAGSAALDVRGNANLSGNSQILILPSANFRLSVRGTANFRGGGIINQGAPRNFTYFGIGGGSDVNFRVTTPLVGGIYAPTAVCTITGGGNAVADLQGAFVARSMVLGGDVSFHFD